MSINQRTETQYVLYDKQHGEIDRGLLSSVGRTLAYNIKHGIGKDFVIKEFLITEVKTYTSDEMRDLYDQEKENI